VGAAATYKDFKLAKAFLPVTNVWGWRRWPRNAPQYIWR